MKAHPGFAAIQKSIQNRDGGQGSGGYTKAVAGAILAARTRKASPAAKKANPNLMKVKC